MKLTRREWLRALLRAAAAGGLAAAAGRGLASRRTGPTEADRCGVSGSCRDCARLRACGHPRARSARRVLLPAPTGGRKPT